MGGNNLPAKSVLSNFAIVLCSPQKASNIGGVARGMMNMGLGSLVLVAPECDPFSHEAMRMARDAWPLIEKAKAEVFPSLKEALSGFHFALAVTGRKGKRRGALHSPRFLAGQLIERGATEKIAMVFGPEDRGLEADQLALCQDTLTIPTDDPFKSLNLAQAVLIVAYELFLAGKEVAKKAASAKEEKSNESKKVKLEQLEPFYGDLQEVLLEIGYLNAQNPEHIMLDLRRLFGRAGLSERELRILRGMIRQIRWAGKDNDEGPN